MSVPKLVEPFVFLQPAQSISTFCVDGLRELLVLRLDLWCVLVKSAPFFFVIFECIGDDVGMEFMCTQIACPYDPSDDLPMKWLHSYLLEATPRPFALHCRRS